MYCKMTRHAVERVLYYNLAFTTLPIFFVVDLIDRFDASLKRAIFMAPLVILECRL